MRNSCSCLRPGILATAINRPRSIAPSSTSWRGWPTDSPRVCPRRRGRVTIARMIRRARAVLGTACATHFVHDGFSDIVYVLLPIWSAEFGLNFAQVGLLKTAYSGGMASGQIPAGLLAERWGEARLLAAGTAVTALGFIAAGLAGGFVGLLVCLLVGGLGSSVQHPLSSSLVSNAYEDRRRTALGTYNFSGDLGKVAVPAAVAFAVPWLGWRGAVEGYAAIGLAAAVVVLLALTNLRIGHAPVSLDTADRLSS